MTELITNRWIVRRMYIGEQDVMQVGGYWYNPVTNTISVCFSYGWVISAFQDDLASDSDNDTSMYCNVIRRIMGY